MMTRRQYILGLVAEECVEIAQRAIKAQRFGLDEKQPGQELTNAERLRNEFWDLLAVIEMLRNEDGSLLLWAEHSQQFIDCILAKKAKVDHFMRYSAELGQVSE